MSTDMAGGSGAAGATGAGTGTGTGGGEPPRSSGGMTAYKLPRHLSPEQVRAASFERAPFGRRGFEEHEVLGYLERVAEELADRDTEVARLEGENRQLKHALREWHRQLVGYDSAEIMARTQQHIEAQIAQAEQYSREREEEATQRYDEIVAEARRRAQEEADRVVRSARESGTLLAGRPAGDTATNGGGDVEAAAQRRAAAEWLRRQQTYVGALQQALGSLSAQVDVTRQAFGVEVDRLTDLAAPPATAPAAAEAEPAPVDGEADPIDADDDDTLIGVVDEPPLEPLPDP